MRVGVGRVKQCIEQRQQIVCALVHPFLHLVDGPPIVLRSEPGSPITLRESVIPPISLNDRVILLPTPTIDANRAEQRFCTVREGHLGSDRLTALLAAFSLLFHALREGVCLPTLRLLEGDVASTLLLCPPGLGGDRLVPLARGVTLSYGHACADSEHDNRRCGDRSLTRDVHARTLLVRRRPGKSDG